MRFVDAPDGWIVVFDGEREVMRFRPPNGGGVAELRTMASADLTSFGDELIRIAKSMRHGAS